jgi:hypothetical protein
MDERAAEILVCRSLPQSLPVAGVDERQERALKLAVGISEFGTGLRSQGRDHAPKTPEALSELGRLFGRYCGHPDVALGRYIHKCDFGKRCGAEFRRVRDRSREFVHCGGNVGGGQR